MRWRLLAMAWVLGISDPLIGLALAGHDEPITLDAVPSTVQEAIDTAVPGAIWSSASREADVDETTYELLGTDAAGHAAKVEVDLAADGAIKAVKPEIRMDQAANSTATAPEPRRSGSRRGLPLWTYAAGMVVAGLGFLVRIIFDGLFQSVGSSLSRALGCDRLIQKIETHLPHHGHKPKPTGPESGDSLE
ncbi:MAG: hypothetical protein ABI353_00845 [Isosphaeraceae bacterium]